MLLVGASFKFSRHKFISGMVSSNSYGSGNDEGLFDANDSGKVGSNGFGLRPFEQEPVIAAAKATQYSAGGGGSIGGIFTASLMSSIRSNSSPTLSEILEK